MWHRRALDPIASLLRELARRDKFEIGYNELKVVFEVSACSPR